MQFFFLLIGFLFLKINRFSTRYRKTQCIYIHSHIRMASKKSVSLFRVSIVLSPHRNMSDSYFIVRLGSRASRTASHGFSVEFSMFRLVNFDGDGEPQSDGESRIIQDSETVWLPNCLVLLHNNGYHLSYLLKDFNFPREKLGEVSRNIAAIARGSETSRKPIIVHLYRMIMMYSLLDTVIWKGIPATKSSIQALEWKIYLLDIPAHPKINSWLPPTPHDVGETWKTSDVQ
jgi:hypothetical protein